MTWLSNRIFYQGKQKNIDGCLVKQRDEEPGMVVLTCYPDIWEAESGKPGGQGYSCLQSEWETSLGYMRRYLTPHIEKIHNVEIKVFTIFQCR